MLRAQGTSSKCEREIEVRSKCEVCERSQVSTCLIRKSNFKVRDAVYRSKLSGVFYCVLLLRRVLFEALTFLVQSHLSCDTLCSLWDNLLAGEVARNGSISFFNHSIGAGPTASQLLNPLLPKSSWWLRINPTLIQNVKDFGEIRVPPFAGWPVGWVSIILPFRHGTIGHKNG